MLIRMGRIDHPLAAYGLFFFLLCQYLWRQLLSISHNLSFVEHQIFSSCCLHVEILKIKSNTSLEIKTAVFEQNRKIEVKLCNESILFWMQGGTVIDIEDEIWSLFISIINVFQLIFGCIWVNRNTSCKYPMYLSYYMFHCTFTDIILYGNVWRKPRTS